MSIVTVERKILEKNDAIAAENRSIFLRENIFVINLLSSPGAGKTSLIERSISEMKMKLRIAVIEGDVQTDLDARRIDALGIPVAQIVTNGACHLDAGLVHKAFGCLDKNCMDILIIENVGNLICPAEFDLGENMKIVVSSTTEGPGQTPEIPGSVQECGCGGD